jgi:hypothetical protein
MLGQLAFNHHRQRNIVKNLLVIQGPGDDLAYLRKERAI